MNNKDNKLIWESYATRAEGIEDDFAEFADENPAPQRTELPHRNLRHSKTIWSAEDNYNNVDTVKRSITEMPSQLQQFFKPDQEGSFLVITATDEFYDRAEAIDGDGMGGITEYSLDGFLVGLEDGNYASYIKQNIHAKNNLQLRRPPHER